MMIFRTAGIACLLVVILRPAAGTSPFHVFPIFKPSTSQFIGFSFVNTSANTNGLNIAYTDADGVITRTGSLSLPPGSQRDALLSEILQIPESLPEGWIRIDSSDPGFLAYMSSGEPGILDGTEPASQVSTETILPHVAVNTGFTEREYEDTLVSLVNPGTVGGNVRAELIGLDGRVMGSHVFAIPSRGSRILRISEVFGAGLPSNGLGGRTFRGYVRVSSGIGLAGWLQIEMPLAKRVLRGRGADEIASTRLATAGHFAYGGPAQYRSELNLINAGDLPVALVLEAKNDRGGSIGEPLTRILKPGEGLREDVLNLFRVVTPAVFPPPLITGYVRSRAADGGLIRLIGDVDIGCGNDAAGVLYPITTTTLFDATLPFVVNDSDYFTGIAIENINEMLTVQTDVTIDVIDRDGHVVGTRKASLPPSARFVSVIEEMIRGGYVRIHTNGPVAVLGSLGAKDCSTLAPLPAVAP